MAKSRKLEETIALLNSIRDHPTSEAALTILQQVLSSKYAIAVAQAAKIVGEFELVNLVPDLTTAFARFMINAESTDVGCTAKFRIAEALYRMGYSEADLFLQGIRHQQLEPVWGGKEDTAADLRSVCALGLVNLNYPDVMSELADLLTDPLPAARAAAVRAIAYREHPDGVPLLRLKVQMGDAAPQVLSECFTALLKLAPERSLSLVSSFLDVPDDQVCELAALALGESRVALAFDLLRSWWSRTSNKERRRVGLLAIAMLRQDSALEFLLSLVETGSLRDAKDAIAALSIYQQDDRLWQQVQQLVEDRDDVSLRQVIAAL